MLILRTHSEIARHLRALRKRKGWTMREAGAIAGLSASEVGNAENPNEPARVTARERLFTVYGYKLAPCYTVEPLEGAEPLPPP